MDTNLDGYSHGEERPLAGYAAIVGLYAASATAFALSLRAAGKELPERIPVEDLVLLAVGTHKLSWIVAHDRVTSFLRAPVTRYEGPYGTSDVTESPRGHGLRLAAGELAICPFCMGQWVASGMLATYAHAPRTARFVAGLFSILSASDFLNMGFAKLKG
jgi:hypothetical protein